MWPSVSVQADNTKYASVKQAPPGWCVRPWACTVHERLCHVSVSVPVWAMSSMLGVSVRTCWGSMRMSPQHFSAKDRYLWTMLCLCCKLALPTTRKRELISFFFYCIISASLILVDWISLLILCCMRFHLVLYHIYIFQISIVSFDILIFLFLCVI